MTLKLRQSWTECNHLDASSNERTEWGPLAAGAAKKAVGKVAGKKSVESKGAAQKLAAEAKEPESKPEAVPATIPVEATLA